MRGRGFLMWVVAANLVIGGVASAEPPAADLRYREGKQLFAAGDYQRAADKFQQAFLLSDDPAHLFNLAQAQRLAGDCPAAYRSYLAYLGRVPDAPNRADVKDKIAVLAACARPEPSRAEPASEPEPERVPAAPALELGSSPAQRDAGGDPEATHGYGGLWVAGGGVASLAVGVLAYRSALAKQDDLARLTDDGTVNGFPLPGKEAEADALEYQMRTREKIAMGAGLVGVGLVAGGLIYHLVQVRKARRARSDAAVQVGLAPLEGGGGILVLGRSDL